MDLEAWSSESSEPGRRRRLALGYLSGLGICALVGSVVLSVTGSVRGADADEELDVKLATSVEQAKPEPPPPPPPAPVNAPPPPPKRSIPAVPTAVPTDAPPEQDPANAKAKSEGHPDGVPGGVPGGVVGGVLGGTGTALTPAPVAPPPPPPPAPPKPSGPIQLPEDATPPQAIANAQPAYPGDARSQGVEATVVVKFVISESGEVQNPKIVRGHPMFDAAVLAAVKSWRYKPAIYQGKPIATFKVVRIPFKIKS